MSSYLTISAKSFNGYKLNPITPPQSGRVPGTHQCIVDSDHQPFSITWSGSSQYPDLTSLPSLKDIIILPVPQSSEIAAIWRESDLFDHGSHASIRISEHTRYPILKLAHSVELSRKLIQYEFKILATLTKLGLPVVEFDPQPILDSGVICGYRMKKLSRLEASELPSRAHDIKQALTQFHHAGFSHGDVSPSNIMTKDGRIILIDPSFAGRLGSEVPTFFPGWVYTDGIFGVGSDLKQFAKYIVST